MFIYIINRIPNEYSEIITKLLCPYQNFWSGLIKKSLHRLNREGISSIILVVPKQKNLRFLDNQDNLLSYKRQTHYRDKP